MTFKNFFIYTGKNASSSDKIVKNILNYIFFYKKKLFFEILRIFLKINFFLKFTFFKALNFY